MTNEQFDALRDFVDNRILLITAMRARANDGTYQTARQRELDEAEEMARSILVDGYHADDEPLREGDQWGNS